VAEGFGDAGLSGQSGTGVGQQNGPLNISVPLDLDFGSEATAHAIVGPFTFGDYYGGARTGVAQVLEDPTVGSLAGLAVLAIAVAVIVKKGLKS